MKRIFKYGPLPIGDPFVLNLPRQATIVHFAAQNGQNLYLWAVVDPDADLRPRHLVVVGTGHPCPPTGYVATWVSDAYVWHLFDGDSLGWADFS